MKRHRKTLTTLLIVALAIMLGLSGCAQTTSASLAATTAPAAATTAPAASTAATASPSAAYQEAPMLSQLVSSGKLPAITDRLPKTPAVITPHDQVGVYGQTLYSEFPTAYSSQAYQTAGFYEPVLTLDSGTLDVKPNLVESFEPSADQKTFRFKIREGLKWSDGEPVTTDDVKFAYNDVWKNTDLNPVAPSTFSINGELCQLNVIDQYTFELIFSKSNITFMYALCRQGFTDQLFLPSHYLKQFHPNYVDKDKLDKMVKDGSFDSWNAMFTNKNTFYTNPDLPVLYAWRLESISQDNLVHKFVRNPYYFKVDTAGNQLPYLDYQQIQNVENTDTLKMKTLSGENEYIYAPPGENMTDWPTYAENAATGDYRLITCSSDFAHIFLLFPNMASTDPQKGPLLANKNFRIALSEAINRDEIIALSRTVGDFKGTPSQQAPVKNSPYYDEELATQYTKYDVTDANKLLDGLGLTARAKDGYRLGPDGKPMSFQITIPTYSQDWVDSGNLIAKYWKAVGLNVEAKAVAPDLWSEAFQANKLDFTIFSTGSGGLLYPNSDGINSYAAEGVNAYTLWGTAFVQYIQSNGAKGVKPPDFVQQLNQLCDEAIYASDQNTMNQKIKELLNVWKENFPLIGISTPLPQFMIIGNKVKNTPQTNEPWVIFPFGVGANVNPCQFYIES